MPSKKQKLITELHSAAKFRGHNITLVDHEQIGRKFWGEWSCNNCGMTAYVNTWPMPNGIEISGEVVAIHCKGKREKTQPMKSEDFKVIKPVTLNDSERMTVENKEALFFYHSYTRSEWELILIAHAVLLEFDENCNYKKTKEYREILNIDKQLNSERLSGDTPQKLRLNCGFTGKFDWIESEYLPEVYTEIMDKLSDYITEVYSIDNYGVYYFEGEWGLWPYEEE